jgi:hypothetical protein
VKFVNRARQRNVFTSKIILETAGQKGMISERAARSVCGFQHLNESKFEAPHQGTKEMRRRQKQLQGKS